MVTKKKVEAFSLTMITVFGMCCIFYLNTISKNTTNDLTNNLISYNINGSRSNVPPAKNTGYHILSVNCTNADGTWDDETWSLKLLNISGVVRCSLSFEKEISKVQPEMYDGLLAVTVDDDGTVKKADTSSQWYDYDDHKWANAVIVSNPSTYASAPSGTTIPMDDILMMYVWIPRYKYKLFNVAGGGDEQMIDVEFQSTSDPKFNGTQNGEYLTHPAFTFGNTELPGFWVAKFEASSTSITSGEGTNFACADEHCASASTLRVLPNVNSARSQTMSSAFYLARSVENDSTFGFNSAQVDTHLIKNIEWGAITYLMASKYGVYADENNCIRSEFKINDKCTNWINPYYAESSTMTGCSSQYRTSSTSTSCNAWNDATYGGVSSTNGNTTGIYDMNGGSWDYVMANATLDSSTFTFSVGNSEFTSAPEDKYYDQYITSSATNFSAGKLGDATKEIVKTVAINGGWFASYIQMPSSNNNWIRRGGRYDHSNQAGLYYFRRATGSASTSDATRIIITAEDAN